MSDGGMGGGMGKLSPLVRPRVMDSSRVYGSGGYGQQPGRAPNRTGPAESIMEGPGMGPDAGYEETGGMTPINFNAGFRSQPQFTPAPTPMAKPGYGDTPMPKPDGQPMPIPSSTGGQYPQGFQPNAFTGQGFQPPQQPQQAPQLGGVRDAMGNTYADRNSSPRAYTGGAFNPAANQWGDYSQTTGDGLWGTDAQGINRVNGHVFAPSGLNSGNNDFANWMQRFAPQFQNQNGPINMGRAQTWGAPPITPNSGLNRGNGPQFDPRRSGLNRGSGPQFDPRMNPPRHGLPSGFSLPTTRPSWQVGDASNNPWTNPYRGSGLSRGGGPQFAPRRNPMFGRNPFFSR